MYIPYAMYNNYYNYINLMGIFFLNQLYIISRFNFQKLLVPVLRTTLMNVYGAVELWLDYFY